MIELERKFLVEDSSFVPKFIDSYFISQYYIQIEKRRELRVRVEEKGAKRNYILGEKIFIPSTFFDNEYLKREEYEVEIPSTAANVLINFAKRELHKIRNTLLDGYASFCVDCYTGHNNGLIIAEAEFYTEKDATSFNPLYFSWLGREITKNKRYLGRNLAHKRKRV